MIVIWNENVSPPADEVLDAGHIRSKRISATFAATAVLALTISRSKDIFLRDAILSRAHHAHHLAPGSGREAKDLLRCFSGLKDFNASGMGKISTVSAAEQIPRASQR
jgi:hypothetical protein